MRVRVLIVDDHAGFRRSAAALLEAEGFEVVGSAGDGRAALAEAERLRPDVVLLDIRLPDGDGFSVAERLTASAQPPAVVLVSSRPASTYGDRFERSPARGFIAKSELSGEAVATLVSPRGGESR
jgi:DNA-binding NarL/FixJ family response regulator